MDKATFFDALDGLMAYDEGATDSGIHDEALRAQVIAHFNTMDDTALRLTLSEYVREHYLTDAQLAKGYGIMDVVGFLEWLRDEIGIHLL